MASECSFDVVCKVDLDEVKNAVSQAMKEIGQRYDFKGTDASIDWSGEVILMTLLGGIGTMVGWRRIVVTVGEKIGKDHLTYAQGAAAELVAMSTIGISAGLGLPVSTTHVLSSGVAGTMVAQGSGLQRQTITRIASAWLLTLPVTMVLAGAMFLAFRALLV